MKSPFELLGLKPSFALSDAELNQRQKELSLELHPDRYTGRPAAERRAALNLAIEVNAAHRLLKNPVKRGEALVFPLRVSIFEFRAFLNTDFAQSSEMSLLFVVLCVP